MKFHRGSHKMCDDLYYISAPCEVKEKISNAELVFLEDLDYSEAKTKLERVVHSNHLFLFALKERFLLLRRKKNETFEEKENALKLRIKIAGELLSTLDLVDPGFTPRRAAILQSLTKDRVTLMKSESGKDEMHEKEIVKEFKELTQCLKVSRSA